MNITPPGSGSAPRIRRVRARQLIRKMRGGSQAALIETSNAYYVTKWLQNGQHRRVLINEAVGSALLRLLNIAVPGWACIDADEEFLKRNPDVMVETGRGKVPILPGRHFGSRYPVDPNRKAVYDLLPARLLPKVWNHVDLLRVPVFDRWVDNRDERQAVYYRQGRGFSALMIDQGHCFGFDGLEWHFTTSAGNWGPFSGISELYEREKILEIYRDTIRSIQAITSDRLEDLLGSLPCDWIQNDTKELSVIVRTVMDRGRRLEEMMLEALSPKAEQTSLRVI